MSDAERWTEIKKLVGKRAGYQLVKREEFHVEHRWSELPNGLQRKAAWLDRCAIDAMCERISAGRLP